MPLRSNRVSDDMNSSLVFGYIRNNYHLFVPEVIIKICLLFYDEDDIHRIKEKALNQFLSSKNKWFYKHININHDLSVIAYMVPNGYDKQSQGLVCLGIRLKSMSDSIASITVSCQLSCYEDPESLHHKILVSVLWNEKNKLQPYINAVGQLSRFKTFKQLYVQFKIRSFQIQYKSGEITHYPSLSAVQCKEVSSIKWNVSPSMIDTFKTYPSRVCYHGPINDHVAIACYPNGGIYVNQSESNGKFEFGVTLLSFPKRVSKILIESAFKVIVDEDEYKDKYELMLEPRNVHKILACRQHFGNDKLKDTNNLVFEAQVVIKKIFDTDGVEISKNKWAEHQLILSE